MSQADSRAPAYRTNGSADPRVERNRSAALDAARAVLAEEGWDAVTHQRVAERAGVHRTTLYRQWPDRLLLLIDAVAAAAAETPHVVPSGDLEDDLRREIYGLRDQFADPIAFRMLIALIERAESDPELMAMKAGVVLTPMAPLMGLVSGGIERGDLKPDLDPGDALSRLLGPFTFKRIFYSEAASADFIDSVVSDFMTLYGVGRKRKR